MKAVVLSGNKMLIKESDIPKPNSGEALIKVIYAAICNTDIELANGYMDYQGILGHEFVGRVIKSENKRWLNKRVVGEINLGCGKCAWCLSGDSRHCPDRSVLGILNKNGAMAEYVSLPIKNLHFVPDSLENKSAVFTEPIAAAFEILEQVHIHPNDHILIIGDGKLGQLIARVLYLCNKNILVVGKSKYKLKLLNDLGIQTVLLDKFKYEQFPLVIEASGNRTGLEMALKCTQPKGKLILKSTIAEKSGLNLAPIVINEIQLIGSRCGPFEPALSALADNRIKVGDLISAIFPITEAQKAFEKSQQKDMLKILISFEND